MPGRILIAEGPDVRRRALRKNLTALLRYRLGAAVRIRPQGPGPTHPAGPSWLATSLLNGLAATQGLETPALGSRWGCSQFIGRKTAEYLPPQPGLAFTSSNGNYQPNP